MDVRCGFRIKETTKIWKQHTQHFLRELLGYTILDRQWKKYIRDRLRVHNLVLNTGKFKREHQFIEREIDLKISIPL